MKIITVLIFEVASKEYMKTNSIIWMKHYCVQKYGMTPDHSAMVMDICM